jgi:hypothetical protein
MIISLDDDVLDESQSKADKLRDNLQIDIHTQWRLWKETLHFRRQSIRDRSTADILKDFPGYGNTLLVKKFDIYFFLWSYKVYFRNRSTRRFKCWWKSIWLTPYVYKYRSCLVNYLKLLYLLQVNKQLNIFITNDIWFQIHLLFGWSKYYVSDSMKQFNIYSVIQ